MDLFHVALSGCFTEVCSLSFLGVILHSVLGPGANGFADMFATIVQSLRKCADQRGVQNCAKLRHVCENSAKSRKFADQQSARNCAKLRK